MNKALLILGIRVTALPLLLFATILALIAQEFFVATLLTAAFMSVLYWLRVQRRALVHE